MAYHYELFHHSSAHLNLFLQGWEPETDLKAVVCLVHDRATTRFACSMLRLQPWIFEHASEFKPPLLILHGTADPVAYPSGSLDFSDRVPGDCTLKLWEGCFHEPHNEPEQEEVLGFFTDWLDSKIRIALDKLDPSWQNSTRS